MNKFLRILVFIVLCSTCTAAMSQLFNTQEILKQEQLRAQQWLNLQSELRNQQIIEQLRRKQQGGEGRCVCAR